MLIAIGFAVSIDGIRGQDLLLQHRQLNPDLPSDPDSPYADGDPEAGETLSDIIPHINIRCVKLLNVTFGFCSCAVCLLMPLVKQKWIIVCKSMRSSCNVLNETVKCCSLLCAADLFVSFRFQIWRLVF